MQSITRHQFIQWFLDMLQQNDSERNLFLEAIANPDTNHVRSVFIHGYHQQWKFDAAASLSGFIVENNVPELANEIVKSVRDKFITAQN